MKKMLPLLHSDVNTPVAVPPPPGFRPLRGAVKVMSLDPMQRRLPHVADTAAKLNGLRYEWTVEDYLIDLSHALDCRALIQPTIKFTDFGSVRICRPDAILELNGKTVVVEIKIQHMPEAWWQLRKLYQPVLESMNAFGKIYCLEIVKSYDAAMPFPEPVELIDSIISYMRQPTEKFAVHVWKP